MICGEAVNAHIIFLSCVASALLWVVLVYGTMHNNANSGIEA